MLCQEDHACIRSWKFCICFNVPTWQFYRVQIGLQSPEGVTTTHVVLRRFSDFLKLSSDVSYIFPRTLMRQLNYRIHLTYTSDIFRVVLGNALFNDAYKENGMNCDIVHCLLQLKRSFRNKKLPPAPPKGLLRMKSRTLLEEVCDFFILPLLLIFSLWIYLIAINTSLHPLFYVMLTDVSVRLMYKAMLSVFTLEDYSLNQLNKLLTT